VVLLGWLAKCENGKPQLKTATSEPEICQGHAPQCRPNAAAILAASGPSRIVRQGRPAGSLPLMNFRGAV